MADDGRVESSVQHRCQGEHIQRVLPRGRPIYSRGMCYRVTECAVDSFHYHRESFMFGFFPLAGQAVERNLGAASRYATRGIHEVRTVPAHATNISQLVGDTFPGF